MKKIAFAGIAVAAALTFAACASTANSTMQGAAPNTPSASNAQNTQDTAEAGSTKPAVQSISVQDAYQRIRDGGLTLVDVRTAEEYAESHIPGAILLPNESIGTQPPAELPVQDGVILVYCRSGRRSAEAAQKLADLGYTNLYDLGGIQDWPYETEAGAWQEPEKQGTLASFSAPLLDGTRADETLFAGHTITMINVWSTTCPFCLREMPDLGELATEYADRGVQIVGIVSDAVPSGSGVYTAQSLSTARDLVEQTGAAYPQLLPSADLYPAILSKVSAVPTTVFVDETGSILGKTYAGAHSKEDWAAIFDALLAQMGDA